MEIITQQSCRRFVTAAAVSMLICMCAAAAPVYGSVARSADQGAVQQHNSTESSSFEDGIEAFYRYSDSMTDSEILAAARSLTSDTGVLYSGLPAEESRKVAKALSAFEETKAAYMTSRINASETVPAGGPSVDTALRREWDRQCAYAQMMIGDKSEIREIIPRYRVTACSAEEDTLDLEVEEWMTQGYGAPDHSGSVNASAYSYSFTLSLQCDADGAWVPRAVNGTEANFTWLCEGEDPVEESGESPPVLYPVMSDAGLQTAAYAEIRTGAADDGTALTFDIRETAVVTAADGQNVQQGTADTMYASDAQPEAVSGAYTYTPARAAAYADQYWKNYNRSYREYRGVDCANFVSQCLFAGGMPKTDDWYPQSVNWINVMGHIRHFKSYGTFLTASDSRVRKGNPVYYDWNGNGTYDHVGICVGTNASGMPVVDAHTNNVYHVPWSMGSRGKRATIQLRTGGLRETAAPAGAKNTWQTVSGRVYYIGSNGKRVAGRFMTIGGARYYFNTDGSRASGFFKVGTKWYYASVKNGKLLKGWQNIGHHIYYFSVKDYSRITAGRHKIGNATYYFNSKGIRQTSFIRIGTKWYYADKTTGKFVKGWRKISGKWYYFDKKTMVKAVGWKTIDGKKCYFNAYGILTKGKHG